MPFPLPKSYNFYSNFVFALVATRIEMTWGVEAWIISKIFIIVSILIFIPRIASFSRIKYSYDQFRKCPLKNSASIGQPANCKIPDFMIFFDV